MVRVNSKRILVLDADMVPSLAIARSLSRQQCEIDVASHLEKPLTRYSNTVNAYFRYPNPLPSGEAFVEWLLRHFATYHYDLVIPLTERLIVPLSKNRIRLQHIKIAMPDTESLEMVLDKSKTLALAERLGVPGPRGVTIDSMDALRNLNQSFDFPVVLKPVRSVSTTEGRSSQLQVSYAFDAQELESGCEHALSFGPIILQEFFPGIGVGIELIAKKGVIVYSFQHQRLHEVPLSGGGSSLRRSVAVTPSLLAAAEKLIAALHWNGVAMVEFKVEPESGKFCLMEINGRFWGSLPLAVAAGADFPAMLLDLELGRKMHPSRPYRKGVDCRLLSRDLRWYEAVIREDADTRIVSIPKRLDVIKELRLFLSFSHRYDVQSILDPRPGLIDIGRILESSFQRARTRYDDMRFRKKQRRAWKSGKVSRAVSQSRSILFLCYGNINRSALAGLLLSPQAKVAGISVASAGFHTEEGRPVDPVMVDIASEFGLCMSQLRSSYVTAQQLEDSDIIFVMDKTHYDKLEKMNAKLLQKTFFLGAHNQRANQKVEISDPYGRSRDVYMACYRQIFEAVDQIKNVISVEVDNRH